jgi:hypothetical protein
MINNEETERIAEIFREARSKPFSLESAVKEMGGFLEASNPKFNRLQFYKDCEQDRLAADYIRRYKEVYGSSSSICFSFNQDLPSLTGPLDSPLDIWLTDNDWTCWLKQIAVSSIDYGYGLLSGLEFEDVTFEILDNDPKMESASEHQKQQIVNHLWAKWQNISHT